MTAPIVSGVDRLPYEGRRYEALERVSRIRDLLTPNLASGQLWERIAEGATR